MKFPFSFLRTITVDCTADAKHIVYEVTANVTSFFAYKHRYAITFYFSSSIFSGLSFTNYYWSSPLHMVPKKNGSWRPCADYRCLNNFTTRLPNVLYFSGYLNGSTVFSMIDLGNVDD